MVLSMLSFLGTLSLDVHATDPAEGLHALQKRRLNRSKLSAYSTNLTVQQQTESGSACYWSCFGQQQRPRCDETCSLWYLTTRSGRRWWCAPLSPSLPVASWESITRTCLLASWQTVTV